MPAQIEAPTKTEQVFVSRAETFKTVRAPELVDVMPGGQQRKIAPGLSYEFDDGVFRVTDDVRSDDRYFFEKYGEHYPPDTKDGGFLSTEDWLRKRAAETNDFHEMGYEKQDPAPALQRVTELAIEGDEEKLLALYVAEQDGDNRPEVTGAIEHALAKLEEREQQGS